MNSSSVTTRNNYQTLTSDGKTEYMYFSSEQSPPLLERFMALVSEALSVSMRSLLSRHVALASPERSSWTDGQNRAKWVSCGRPGGNGDNGLQELADWLAGWGLAWHSVRSFHYGTSRQLNYRGKPVKLLASLTTVTCLCSCSERTRQMLFRAVW